MRLFLLITLLSLLTTLHAKNPLDIQLVANTTHIQPGQPFEVALHLDHPRKYHTYWKQPGIVGVPTQIDWQLPKGWKADPIQWPTPKIVLMFDIRAQGYHGETLLPIKITPPDQITETHITLQGRASWMCCYKDCNPGTTTLTLTLPILNQPTTPHPHWNKLFQKTHANIPQPLQHWTTSASIHKNNITLTLTPSTNNKKHAQKIQKITFFTEDGLINPNIDQTLQTHSDGSLSLHLKISEYFSGKIPTHLTGLLQTTSTWSPSGPSTASIHTPLTK